MLEFTEVFPKRLYVGYNNNNVQTIMKCKNIVFDHVDWFGGDNRAYDHVDFMFYLIDNIVDINVHDNGIIWCYTFFAKILVYSNIPAIIHHILNTKCIQYDYFEQLSIDYKVRCVCCK